ncbi:hypothetical protein HDU97_006271 [Phlyctochytrium planicorne]|nr:hypothetical protein HDU97_006271 [Phlyctochytrium planicorne]
MHFNLAFILAVAGAAVSVSANKDYGKVETSSTTTTTITSTSTTIPKVYKETPVTPIYSTKIYEPEYKKPKYTSEAAPVPPKAYEKYTTQSAPAPKYTSSSVEKPKYTETEKPKYTTEKKDLPYTTAAPQYNNVETTKESYLVNGAAGTTVGSLAVVVAVAALAL